MCVIFPGYITTDKLPIAKFKVEEFEQFANVTQEFFLQVYSMEKKRVDGQSTTKTQK